MDKKDIIYIVGGLCIILIIALVLKPALTGKPINTGIPVATTTLPVIVTIASNASIITPVITTSTPITTEPTPTPIPTWDKSVYSVVFVEPSTYGVSFNQSLPGGTRIDSTEFRNTSMTTIAKINGQYSGTTQIIIVPFPYWEMWYTVDPFADMGGQKQTLSSSTVKGPSGSSETVIQGSFSTPMPTFSIQVMDAYDPNRIIRTITPPGGLDKALWTGKSVTSGPKNETTITIPDPRPWKEKFYEGNKNYYFIINTHAIKSYGIEIRVPTRYIE
ncbi:MAG: hypothetical protein Q7U51_12665 [Methanoregula sp.]|nr:hypothetical protein [Methanoregula sp.]